MKQTKSKKSMKQFLTLALAFVMVFTGMGIGIWGVDKAVALTSQDVVFHSVYGGYVSTEYYVLNNY